MYAYLRLIRLHHLVLIAALQCFIRYFLLIPLLNSAGFEPLLSNQDFILLVISCFFLAAGGYIINDYFDLKSDYYNRPDSVVVGKNIPRRMAMALHLALTFLGIVLMGFVAYQIKVVVLVMIGVLVSGLLWFYSTHYKHQFLVGNFVIALLAFIVVIVVPVFEPMYFQLLFSGNDTLLIDVIVRVIGFYAVVVFLLAFVHTLVKDMEDMDGDLQVDSHTLPISFGIAASRWIVLGLLISIMAVVGYVQYIQLQSATNIHFVYLLVFVQAPLLVASYFTFMGKEPEDFTPVKRLLTFVMYAGVVSVLVFRFLDAG